MNSTSINTRRNLDPPRNWNNFQLEIYQRLRIKHVLRVSCKREYYKRLSDQDKMAELTIIQHPQKNYSRFQELIFIPISNFKIKSEESKEIEEQRNKVKYVKRHVVLFFPYSSWYLFLYHTIQVWQPYFVDRFITANLLMWGLILAALG